MDDWSLAAGETFVARYDPHLGGPRGSLGGHETRSMYAPPPALNLVVLRSVDIDRAAAFYSAMGLLMTVEAHRSGPHHYVSRVAGLVFELYPLVEGHATTRSTRLGFQVDSVDELVPMLVAAGGSLIARPRDIDGGRRAVVADVDGHKIELFTPTQGHQLGPYLDEPSIAAPPSMENHE